MGGAICKEKKSIITTFRCVCLSLDTDGSENSELKIKGIEEVEVGDWRLPVTQSGNDEAAEAMPMFAGGRARLEKPSREAAARKAAAEGAVLEPEEVTDIVEDEVEEAEIIAELVAYERRARRAVKSANWEWDHGQERSFTANMLNGRTRCTQPGYLTAEEAENSVEDAFETDASASDTDGDRTNNGSELSDVESVGDWIELE